MAFRNLFIYFLIGIAGTHAYGDVEEVGAVSFEAIYEYSKLKLDSASILLDRKGDLIDFDIYGNETAFEFFLVKADIHYNKRNYKALESLLETATEYYEASENEFQKTMFDYWTYLVDEYHTIGSRKDELEKLVLKADSIDRLDLYMLNFLLKSETQL